MPPSHETAPTTDAVRDRARRVAPAVDPARNESAGPAVAVPHPHRGMPSAVVRRLQQQAGNAAVSRLLRPPDRRELPPEPVAGATERDETEAPGAARAEVLTSGAPATEGPPGGSATPRTSQASAPATTAGAVVGEVDAEAPGEAPAARSEAAPSPPAPSAPGLAALDTSPTGARRAPATAEGGGAPVALDQRPATRPAPVDAPAGSASTVGAAPPAPAVDVTPAVEPAPAAAVAEAAPSVEVGGGGGGEGDGAPPSPPPGLGDEELAVLDEGTPAGGPATEPEGEVEPAPGPEPSAPVEAEPAPPEDAGAVEAGPEPADVGPADGTLSEPAAAVPDESAGSAEAPADEESAAVVDPAAAQEAVASGAQAEVEESSSPGPEPAEESGGGGGGAAVEDRPVPPPPDVSAAPPEQAMATVAALRPTQMAATLGGVESAAGSAVAREQARLAAAPPRHTPLAGATQSGPASDQVPTAGAAVTARVRAIEPGAARPTPPPGPLPTPPPAAVARAAPPPLPASPEGGLTEDSARDLAASIDRMPTRDPGAAITPGPAPQLQLAGDADPGQVGAQQAELAEGAAHAQAEGTRDAAEPMGEDAVRPTVAVETVEAEVAGGGAAGPAAAAAPAAAPAGDGAAGEDAAVDAVVEEQQGPAIRSAAAAGAAQMAAARQQHTEQEQTQRAQSAQQVAALEAQHAQAEAAQRAEVRADVAGQRTAWRAEQGALVAGARAEAGAVTAEATATVTSERANAQAEAAQAHTQGQQEATQARQAGEQEAARARAEARQESGGGGFFGWLASKATALFDKVKAGISAAFEKARQAVRAAVEKAQALATAVIEKARQVVVAAIRLAGSALTAIGDRLLAAFPAVRERFRNAIRAAVQRAEAAVNRLADGLKAGVRAAIGLLGRALTAALNGLEAGLKAAVNAVAATVNGAINAARAALAAIGAFLAVAKDVAANPGAWLRNLGAAVVDGIRNHLWKALKTAVQQWFNDKVEQVLGLGRAVWNLLTKGGISIAKIGAMAWEGLKAAIPAALIGLLVEKLVSMIVPAAGAVLAIIQGLQAAWGTVSRILQAIDKFVAFLRAVKTGMGGPAFAAVLAAAAITVVDFVANWLLARLAKGAGKIAGKIREIAKKIGAALKKAAKKVGGALKKLGKKIGAKLRGLRNRFRSWRARRNQKKGKDGKTNDQRSDDRLAKAARELPGPVNALFGRGVTGVGLRARLLRWRLTYRLRSLETRQQGTGAIVVARTTEAEIAKGIRKLGDDLHRLIRDIAERVMADPEVQRQVLLIVEHREMGLGKSKKNPRPTQGAAAEASVLITNPRPERSKEFIHMGSAVVGEQQTRGEQPGFIRTLGLGAGHYPAIVKQIRSTKTQLDAELRAAGVGNPQAAMAQAVLAINDGRPAPPPFHAGRPAMFLSSLTRLLFHVEPGRSPSALVSNLMAVEAAAARQTGLEEAVTDLNTMSPEGAGADARAAGARVGYPVPSESTTMASGPRALGFLEREKRAAIAYVSTLVRAKSPIYQTDEQWQRFIAKELRDFLLNETQQHMIIGSIDQ